MATLYYLSTLPQSRWADDHTDSKSGYRPVLNDLPGKGDQVHADFDAAWKLAQDLAYDLPGAKGMDVIEVKIDDALYSSLVQSGDIKPAAAVDCFGAELVALSENACRLINHSAVFEKKEFLIPEEVLLLLGSGETRGSVTMH